VRAKQGDNHSRVDEDDKVGYDHEGRALDLATFQAIAALLAACQIVTTLEKNSRYDGKCGREAGESFRYGDRESVGAGRCVTERVSPGRRSATTSLPCHGSCEDKVYDADERDDLFPGVARHLGCCCQRLRGTRC
jgi:hypothetical protein